MDTSETYIKMCEKAEEIQEQKREAGLVHGDYYCEPHLGQWDIIYDKNRCYKFGMLTCIWLPRQDQLQEMIEYENIYRLAGKFNAFCNPPKRMKRPPLVILEDGDNSEEAMKIRRQAHEEAIRILNPEELAYPLQFTSMEQLWLAFVMKEKHNKIWSEGEWIKS